MGATPLPDYDPLWRLDPIGVIVSERLQIAPRFLGGARTDTFGDWLRRRGQIVIERLCLGRRATAGRQGDDPNHADHPTLREGQHITGPDRGCLFLHLLAIDAHMAARHGFRGQAPGLEEPRLPEPLVQPVFDRLSQLLSFSPARAWAKGLSGSIRSFLRSGLAEKL